MDVPIRAKAFAKLLALGFASPRKVVAWVDSLIAKAEVPSAFLIDASLSETRPAELISALERYGETAADTSATWSVVLAELHVWFRDHPDDGPRIADTLYQMAVAGQLPRPELEGDMYSLADEYELAWNGVYGRPEDVDAHLEEVLSQFVP